MRLAITILALALTASLPASAAAPPADQGFNAQSVERFLEQHPDAAPSPVSRLSDTERAKLRALFAAAEGFRYLAVTDLGGLRRDLAPGGQALATRLFGADDGTPQAHLWQFFLEGSLIYIGDGLAATPRTGFYNPQADAWLVADWRAASAGGASRMELVALQAVTGDTMREVRRAHPLLAYWLSLDSGSVAAALAESHRVGVGVFEARFPLLGKTAPPPMPDERRTLEARLTIAAASLAGLDGAPAYRDAVARLEKTLAAGDAETLRTLVPGSAPAPAERLAGMSGLIRQTLKPNGVYRRPDGLSVVLGAPFSGRYLVVADYDDGQAPALKNLAFIDLAAVEPR